MRLRHRSRVREDVDGEICGPRVGDVVQHCRGDDLVHVAPDLQDSRDVSVGSRCGGGPGKRQGYVEDGGQPFHQETEDAGSHCPYVHLAFDADIEDSRPGRQEKSEASIHVGGRFLQGVRPRCSVPERAFDHCGVGRQGVLPDEEDENGA